MAEANRIQPLGQQTIGLSVLVKKSVAASFIGLKELTESCPEQSDSERKISLLKYIFRTRQRLLRILAISKWCRQIPLVERCQQLVGTLSNHDLSFVSAADSLFFLHESLQQARAPVYDIPTAAEVLLSGGYHRLPKCIEDLSLQAMLDGEKKETTLQKLDTLLRARLLDIPLPKELSSVIVKNGCVTLHVDGEFEVQLTLGYRGNISLWRIVHLNLLVGEPIGIFMLTEVQKLALADDLERRMASLENPFGILYSVLHDICVSLVVDTVFRQVRALRQGRWKDALRFDVLSDISSTTHGTIIAQAPAQVALDGDTTSVSGPKSRATPALKITYWMEMPKVSGSIESPPCIRIDPGPEQQITTSHQPPVVDPATGTEASLFLDQSCIDIERLILKAISCHIHTRLLEIQISLKNHQHIYRVDDDVFLRFSSQEAYNDIAKKSIEGDSLTTGDNTTVGEEVLCVRSYGDLYMTLGISVRTGRFTLKCPGTSSLQATVQEMEEALNQGSMSPLDIFISLRSKCLLHCFASIGMSFGLKAYPKGAFTMKFPEEGPKTGDVLVMGFPSCGNSYFVLIELDNNFLPTFKLLESEVEASSHTNPQMGLINVRRFMRINDGIVTDADAEFAILYGSSEHQKFDMTGVNVDEMEIDQTEDMFGSIDSGFATVPLDQRVVTALPPLSRLRSMESAGQQGGRATYNNQYSCGSPNVPHRSRVSALDGIGSPGASQLGASPLRNRLYSKPSPKLEDVAGSKSPIDYADNVTSPVDLDDDHLSQLIDSISSKTIPSSTNLPNTLDSLTVPGVRKLHQSPWDSSTLQDLSLNYRSDSKNKVFSQVSTSMISAGSPLCRAQTSVGISLVAQELDDSLGSAASERPSNKTFKRKRVSADVLRLPSLTHVPLLPAFSKRRRIDCCNDQNPQSFEVFVGQTYSNIISAANQGKSSLSSYTIVLLQVVKSCWLSIKHACLTHQMDALHISYNEGGNMHVRSADLHFRLPARGPGGSLDGSNNAWQHMYLSLGKPGSSGWEVKVSDSYYKGLWELQKQKITREWDVGVQFGIQSQSDSHITCSQEGLILKYKAVETNSIKRLLADLERLRNARAFALEMRRLLDSNDAICMRQNADIGNKTSEKEPETKWEVIKKSFKVESVGLTSLWFSYTGSMPGISARFVVEWCTDQTGCTIHISPEQLWPHTKYLEDFINGGTVELLLDAIWITAGPLQSLAGAIRPARMTTPVPNTIQCLTTGTLVPKSTVASPSNANITTISPMGPSAQNRNSTVGLNHPLSVAHNAVIQNTQVGVMTSGPGRGSGPGLVPSSLLPTDISVLLRSPYSIRIVYRKQFAVDMRCFAGDQVWLQPAPPVQDGAAETGGSLPCPQFRPFIMENVALGLNSPESALGGNGPGTQLGSSVGLLGSPTSFGQIPPGGLNRASSGSVGVPRNVSTALATNKLANTGGFMAGSSGFPTVATGIGFVPSRSLVMGTGAGVYPGYRGELNSAFFGMGDDGAYGGAWVPLAALKKVLRSMLRYLGVLWLFAQFPKIIQEVLGSYMNGREGNLLHLDVEQPALRFNIGSCMFAVNMHRHQLYLQGVNVKRFQPQQQQQPQQQPQQQQQSQQQPQQQQQPPQQQQQQHQHQQQLQSSDADLSNSEMSEIADFFARRVASEPYDASRLASFVTMLTLPVPVLREFLGLISWKRDAQKANQVQGSEASRPRVELCLENRIGLAANAATKEDSSVVVSASTSVKSSIHHDRSRNFVDFALTVFLDLANVPHVNAAGGAAWLPQCVAVKLRYHYGENGRVIFLNMEGSHGGRACWIRPEEWERCREKVEQALETSEAGHGRLRAVAEAVQLVLQSALQQLRASTM